MTQHRHGRSVPTRIPTRGPHETASTAWPRSSMTRRLDTRSSRLSASVMPIARVRLPGTAAQIGVGHVAADATSLPHERDALDRLQRANQHGGRMPLGFGDRVDQVMDAVIQIDVGKARRSIERRVAAGRPRRRMAGGIAFADVRLGLDDHAGGHTPGRPMHEHLAQQCFSNRERRPAVERPRQ